MKRSDDLKYYDVWAQMRQRCTAFGETKTMAEWLEDERCRVGRNTLKNRVFRGWTDEDAISLSTTNRWERRDANLG